MVVPANNKAMKDDYKRWEKKRIALKKILNFIMYPTNMPREKYEQLKAYIGVLSEKKELSIQHYQFLNRVLDIEFAMMIANLDIMEEI